MTTTTYPRDAREVQESPLIQGVWESRAYAFDFAGCGVTSITAASASVTLDGADVSATVMPSGAASFAGLIVTTPKLTALVAGQTYLLYARVTHDGGQQTELYCRVVARA